MKFKLMLVSIFVTTLLFGMTTTVEPKEKKNDVLSKKEVITLFTNMVAKVMRYYYTPKDFDFDIVLKKIEKRVKAGEVLTKNDLYAMFNDELYGKSGFYTETQLKKNLLHL